MHSQPEADAKPEPEVAIGLREQLLHLLGKAAEIDHTLMCSYSSAAIEPSAAASRW